MVNRENSTKRVRNVLQNESITLFASEAFLNFSSLREKGKNASQLNRGEEFESTFRNQSDNNVKMFYINKWNNLFYVHNGVR